MPEAPSGIVVIEGALVKVPEVDTPLIQLVRQLSADISVARQVTEAKREQPRNIS